MSSTYSAVSADSASDSSGPECEPLPSVKSTPSVEASSGGTGQMSLALPTSENSASPPSSKSAEWDSHESMSYAEASRARTSAQRASLEQDSTANEAAFGASITGLFGKYDRASQSWKTPQHCFIGGSDDYSESWPRSGMTLNGTAYVLPALVPHSLETESTFLPRPTRSMGKRGWGFAHTYGVGRYAGRVVNFAVKFGWRPPTDLLEWAMGFPIGWTAGVAPKDSVTPSSRKSRKSSAKQS
jgi:hypothetical protein